MNGSTTPTGRALSVALTRFHHAARTLEKLRRRGGRVPMAALDLAVDALALEAVAWAEAERRHERRMRAWAKRAVVDLNRLRKTRRPRTLKEPRCPPEHAKKPTRPTP